MFGIMSILWKGAKGVMFIWGGNLTFIACPDYNPCFPKTKKTQILPNRENRSKLHNNKWGVLIDNNIYYWIHRLPDMAQLRNYHWNSLDPSTLKHTRMWMNSLFYFLHWMSYLKLCANMKWPRWITSKSFFWGGVRNSTHARNRSS